MRFSPLLEQLIEAFRCLPGVGPKTAQRMALHLLTRRRDNGRHLAQMLLAAMEHIGHCQQCRVFSETALCEICTSHHRDTSLLCIVESPVDVSAIEQTSSFKGTYFVLHGRLSPLDGIGPNEIGIEQLSAYFQKQQHPSQQRPLAEVIIATNPTVEGEATAHYLSGLAKQYAIPVTRIARGVAIGSELEYIDPNTLAHAFAGRERIE